MRVPGEFCTFLANNVGLRRVAGYPSTSAIPYGATWLKGWLKHGWHNSYRINAFGSDGHVMRASPFECSGDEEAIEKTKHLVEGQPLELWSGVKFIGRFEPTRAA
jgi:hypothetical protein